MYSRRDSLPSPFMSASLKALICSSSDLYDSIIASSSFAPVCAHARSADGRRGRIRTVRSVLCVDGSVLCADCRRRRIFGRIRNQTRRWDTRHGDSRGVILQHCCNTRDAMLHRSCDTRGVMPLDLIIARTHACTHARAHTRRQERAYVACRRARREARRRSESGPTAYVTDVHVWRIPMKEIKCENKFDKYKLVVMRACDMSESRCSIGVRGI